VIGVHVLIVGELELVIFIIILQSATTLILMRRMSLVVLEVLAEAVIAVQGVVWFILVMKILVVVTGLSVLKVFKLGLVLIRIAVLKLL